MPLFEHGYAVAICLFYMTVVGGGGGVAQYHGCLAFKKEPIGFRPAFSHSHNSGRQHGPGILVSGIEYFAHPQHKPQSRGAGAGILDDDARPVTVIDQFRKTSRRDGKCLAVVDEAKVAEVVRHKDQVGPG